MMDLLTTYCNTHLSIARLLFMIRLTRIDTKRRHVRYRWRENAVYTKSTAAWHDITRYFNDVCI